MVGSPEAFPRWLALKRAPQQLQSDLSFFLVFFLFFLFFNLARTVPVCVDLESEIVVGRGGPEWLLC